MASLLFYDDVVPLNKETHKEVKIATLKGNYSFATKTNSVIVAGIEFAQAAKEYPVVFSQAEDDRIVPVVLLGLRAAENLFVAADGSWLGDYVPAYIRRYPFVLAGSGQQEQLAVCIDRSYAGYDAAEGQRLFDDDGEQTPLLKRAVDFLGDYLRQYRRTEEFVQRLRDAELLVAMNARMSSASGKGVELRGFMIVDEKKLLALDDDKALALFRAGELSWIYAHLLSVSNLKRLVDLAAGDSAAE